MSEQSAAPRREPRRLVLSVVVDSDSTAMFLDLFRETIDSSMNKIILQVKNILTAGSTAESATAPAPASQSPGTELTHADRLRAADLRVAVLTGKVPEDTGLLIGTKTLAKLLCISIATLNRFQSQQVIPAPVRLGHLRKWRLTEILEWLEADCPPQRAWAPEATCPQKMKESPVRKVAYHRVLRPSVNFLKRCGNLMVDTKSLGEFLGLSDKAVFQLSHTDRIPLPCRLGRCHRWSVLELLEWVESGCPRRTKWI